MDFESYKKLQFESISGYSGSNEFKILGLTFISMISLVLLKLIKTHKVLNKWLFNGPWFYSRVFLVESIVIVLPQIAVLLFTNSVALIYLGCLSACLVLTILNYFQIRHDDNVPKIQSTEPRSHKLFIDNFRGCVMLQTYISIFGVDFQVYPRELVKTETFGVSLMDVGVGCYIFISALTFSLASSSQNSSKNIQLQRLCKSTGLLLCLGLSRVFFVKAFNYQEHVSEYGVHWNFFMSLGFLNLITGLCTMIFSPGVLFGIAVVIISYYQSFLSNSKLSEYIFSENRQNLFDKNKEGIFSLIGYTFIHLCTYNACKFLFSASSPFGNNNKLRIFAFFGFNVCLWTVYHWTKHGLGIAVSRRLANLSFGLWMLVFNFSQLFSPFLMDVFFSDYNHESFVFSALNYNPLSGFLVANLLTGLANLLFQTLLLSKLQGGLCILLYIECVLLFVFILKYKLHLKIK